MVALSTRSKIRIAYGLYGAVKLARLATGRTGDDVICQRKGLRWKLNLQEGIDLAIYLFGEFEKQTAKAIRRALKPRMTVFDIGANSGAHALPMAKLVGPQGRVYAFEPTEQAYDRLLANKALNPSLKDILIPVKTILTDATGARPEKIYSSWKIANSEDSAHPHHGGSSFSVESTPEMTLDEFVETSKISQLDFIKMDVDGYEVKEIGRAHV